VKSGGRLTRRKRLKSRKRLRPRSSKMQKLYEEERIQFVTDTLAARPRCELPDLIDQACDTKAIDHRLEVGSSLFLVQARCQRHTVDVHEILSRGRGGPIVPSQGLTQADVLALCRNCHDWVTEHSKESGLIGATAHSWDNRFAGRDPIGD
jgi:hypothetical protein